MSCPKCATELENFSTVEGGWCPDCEEWYPPDLIENDEYFEAEDEEMGEGWGSCVSNGRKKP